MNTHNQYGRKRPGKRSRIVAALALAGALLLSGAPDALAKDASSVGIGGAEPPSARAICWVYEGSANCIEHEGTCGEIGMQHGVEVNGGVTCYDYWA